MRSSRALRCLILAVCCGITGCDPVSAGAANGTVVQAGADDGVARSYPDWAAAVVPAYPHALSSSGPITPKLYGIATTDRMPVVVAWYKSRVPGAWSESEGGNTWSVKSGGVRIQISANFYDDSGAEKPGTRVALTRYP